jgi:hypothetical protein
VLVLCVIGLRSAVRLLVGWVERAAVVLALEVGLRVRRVYVPGRHEGGYEETCEGPRRKTKQRASRRLQSTEEPFLTAHRAGVTITKRLLTMLLTDY